MGLSLWECGCNRFIIYDHHFHTAQIHDRKMPKIGASRYTSCIPHWNDPCPPPERLQVTALMKAGIPVMGQVSDGLGVGKATKETKEITRKPRQRPPKIRGPEWPGFGSVSKPIIIFMLVGSSHTHKSQLFSCSPKPFICHCPNQSSHAAYLHGHEV